MMNSVIIAIGGILGIMIVWIAVQALWRKVFAEYISDEDVMAGRTSCGNCGCTTACTKQELTTDSNHLQ
jgi:hypothetical protein